MPFELIEPLAQLGVAGLMAALWIRERLLSRQRENELTEAHQRLIADREKVCVLVRLVRRNTQMIERFHQTQSRLTTLLERVQSYLNNDPRR